MNFHMKNTKRIVILDKINSNLIEQAIFILKDSSTPENEAKSIDAVTEAQRIIRDYLSDVKYSTYAPKKTKGKKDVLLPVISVLSFLTIVVFVCFLVMYFLV